MSFLKKFAVVMFSSLVLLSSIPVGSVFAAENDSPYFNTPKPSEILKNGGASTQVVVQPGGGVTDVDWTTRRTFKSSFKSDLADVSALIGAVSAAGKITTGLAEPIANVIWGHHLPNVYYIQHNQ
ncbi:hypothetical protein QRD89_07465 [Halobacillus sp. ACCC02827]|uniref:hypothetical protein n=1 Tax=Halobacillus sp. ACCC02827 TaxID=3052090 RepID=UPI0025703BD3|nr:hypothetical protein [Halobacillus sp. ACCC02827]WJE17181.1 hypothetical protein QRD89_07465 [Halobacillus sp. ACCC02827]